MPCLPRAFPYAPNSPALHRSVDEACTIARDAGVEWDDDMIQFAERSPKASPLPANQYAQYFGLKNLRAGIEIGWERWFVHDVTRRVPVFVEPYVFDSDEHIIAVFAHEAFEIGSLYEEFQRRDKRLLSEQLHSLLNEENGTLHCLAWDHSDRVLGAWRNRR